MMMGMKMTLRGNISFSYPENVRRMLSGEFVNNDLKGDNMKTSMMAKTNTIKYNTGN